MVIGKVAMGVLDSGTGKIGARLFGGAGGVLLNVQMRKMVADCFAGREIETAVAIFVNSWPAGIALSLLTLPLIGTAYGVGAVYLAVAALIGFCLVLLAVTYQPPANSVTPATTSERRGRGRFDLGVSIMSALPSSSASGPRCWLSAAGRAPRQDRSSALCFRGPVPPFLS